MTKHYYATIINGGSIKIRFETEAVQADWILMPRFHSRTSLTFATLKGFSAILNGDASNDFLQLVLLHCFSCRIGSAHAEHQPNKRS